MKHLVQLLLVLSLALVSMFTLTGCKEPPKTNPEQPPAAEQHTNAKQETAATAPPFSLNDLYTGKPVQIPADIKGTRTALVFFSLT